MCAKIRKESFKGNRTFITSNGWQNNRTDCSKILFNNVLKKCDAVNGFYSAYHLSLIIFA
jgi:hypothetical protein